MTLPVRKPANWRGLLRWLPGVIISILAFVVLFRLARFEDLSSTLRLIKWPYVALAIVLTVVSLGTRAQAWRTLIGEHRLTFWRSFFGISEGYLLNNILPLRAGEIGRAVFIGRATGLGPFFILSTIVIERAFDIAMAAVLLLLTLPLALSFEWAKPIAIIALVAVAAGLFGVFLAARNRVVVNNWLHKRFGRFAFFNHTLSRWIDSVLQGFASLTSFRQFAMSLFWIAVSWVIWVVMYWEMLRMIIPTAPLWWAAFADAVLAMGIAVPSAPGSLGVFEASMVGALSILGVETATALAYALLMHLIQYVATGVLGLIGLIREGQSLSSIFSTVTHQPGESIESHG